MLEPPRKTVVPFRAEAVGDGVAHVRLRGVARDGDRVDSSPFDLAWPSVIALVDLEVLEVESASFGVTARAWHASDGATR